MRLGVDRFGVSKTVLPFALVVSALGACGGRTLDDGVYDVYVQPSLPAAAGNDASGGAVSSGGAPAVGGAPSAGGSAIGGSAVGGSAPSGGDSSTGEAGATQGGAHSVGGGPGLGCGGTPHSNGSLRLIDDMEDHQGFINQYEGRKGAWFSFNDGAPGSMQFPPPGVSPFPMRYVGNDATGGRYAAYTAGSNFSAWGAGIGVELNDGCPYDASVYEGLHFYARGESGDTLLVRMPTARAYSGFDGTCTSMSTSCSNVYQTALTLSPEWQEYYVAFNELQPANPLGSAGFDPTTMLRLEFEAPPSNVFSFSLDALTFF